jgi:O-antigen/teichoic acid export membrane protein
VSLPPLMDVAGFSASMMLSQMLFLLLIRAQDVIVGGFLAVTAVGTYRIAWRIFELITQTTLFPIATVSIVTLARLQDDRAAFANAYGRMLGLAALFALPAILGFGMISEDLVASLFGLQWAGSGLIGKILAFMAPAYLLNFFMGPVLAAAGRSQASVTVASVEVMVTVVMSVIAAPFGLAAVTIAYVVRAYATMPYLMHVLKRETGINCGVIARNILPPLWASLFMVGILLVLETPMSQHGHSHIAKAVISIVAGVLAYAVGLLLFARRFLASHYQAIRPLLAQKAAKPAGDIAAGPIPS